MSLAIWGRARATAATVSRVRRMQPATGLYGGFMFVQGIRLVHGFWSRWMRHRQVPTSAAVAAVATIVPIALVVGTATPASASTWTGSVSLLSSASTYVSGGPQPTLVASVSP